MRLLNSKILYDDVIELSIDDQKGGEFDVGHTVDLLEDNGTYYLRQRDKFIEAEVNSDILRSLTLAQSEARALTVIVYKTLAGVAVKYAPLSTKSAQDFRLRLEPLVISNIANEAGVQAKIDTVSNWLKQEFCYENEYGHECLLLNSDHSAGYTRLSLLGETKRAVIRKHGKFWEIDKLEPIGRINGPISQYSGTHSFIYTSGDLARQAEELNFALEQHIADAGSYFRLWEKYAEIDWQQNQNLAVAAGFMKYESYEATSTERREYKFKVSPHDLEHFRDKCSTALEAMGQSFTWSGIDLQIGKQLPEWLDDHAAVDSSNRKPTLLFDARVDEGGWITAEANAKPSNNNGYIFLSLNGTLKQHQRKQAAFDALKKSQNPLPQLRFILEDQSISAAGRRKKIRPESESLKKKLGNKKLNEGQRKALKVALNTPDIALIIGPPGTGKTQVISALQHRLAEEGDRVGAPVQYQTLLTSYQHDAVDNVVARSGVFGLPALKVGGRYGTETTDRNLEVRSWIAKRVAQLEETLKQETGNYPELEAYEQLTLESQLVKSASGSEELARCLAQLMRTLQLLQDKHGVNISADLLTDLVRLKSRYGETITSLSTKELSGLRRRIKALRTTQIAFDDDGEARLSELQGFLGAIDAPNGWIEKLCQLTKMGFDELAYEEIKLQMLTALKPKYVPKRKRLISAEDVGILDEVVEKVEEQLLENPFVAQLSKRAHYVETLKTNERRVQSSLEDYVAVLGATCQQAAGEQVHQLKSVSHSASVTFKSVIVDEAARANPLDLMIPMAMAQERVILVGDHRQLPHMLEPRVEAELQESKEELITASELLKQSLFERLYHTLKRLDDESIDKRVAMLDTQYRMHPRLGDFVSEHFYEAAGLPKVKSGLLAEDFRLDVPDYEGRVGAWIDVPYSHGKASSKNGSKYRDVEAQRVADEAFKLLVARPDLSVGVITFYAAQRDLIQEKMVSKGVLSRVRGGFSVEPDYELTEGGDERFRVGTVDAFQGKEFDVVLLSPVRSWSMPSQLNEHEVNKRLGFLRIPNRINVAMSRQKLLLIIIGDQSLADPVLNGYLPDAERDLSQKLLLGFPAFYSEFCSEKWDT